MNRAIKVSLYIGAAILLTSAGLLFAQLKTKAAPKDLNHKYLELAKSYMETMSGVRYDYTYTLQAGTEEVDRMQGRLYKIDEENYVDSNNYYSKVLLDDIYVLYNHQERTAQYLNVVQLEQQLGVSRKEVFKELFQIPDSSFFELGTVQVNSRENGLVDFNYQLKDTTSQVRSARFVIEEQSGKLVEVYLHFNLNEYKEMGYNPEGVEYVASSMESVLRIWNISPCPEQNPVGMLKSMYFTIQGAEQPELAGRFKSYTLTQL